MGLIILKKYYRENQQSYYSGDTAVQVLLVMPSCHVIAIRSVSRMFTVASANSVYSILSNIADFERWYFLQNIFVL